MIILVLFIGTKFDNIQVRFLFLERQTSRFRTQVISNYEYNRNQKHDKINIDTEVLALVNKSLLEGVPKVPLARAKWY